MGQYRQLLVLLTEVDTYSAALRRALALAHLSGASVHVLGLFEPTEAHLLREERLSEADFKRQYEHYRLKLESLVEHHRGSGITLTVDSLNADDILSMAIDYISELQHGAEGQREYLGPGAAVRHAAGLCLDAQLKDHHPLRAGERRYAAAADSGLRGYHVQPSARGTGTLQPWAHPRRPGIGAAVRRVVAPVVGLQPGRRVCRGHQCYPSLAGRDAWSAAGTLRGLGRR